MNKRKVVGLDEEIKPFLTMIPVVAVIIVALMISSDKHATTEKKITTFIINSIFIVLSILFIWLDIPYKIMNY